MVGRDRPSVALRAKRCPQNGVAEQRPRGIGWVPSAQEIRRTQSLIVAGRRAVRGADCDHGSMPRDAGHRRVSASGPNAGP